MDGSMNGDIQPTVWQSEVFLLLDAANKKICDAQQLGEKAGEKIMEALITRMKH